jgi:hypothetical protein
VLDEASARVGADATISAALSSEISARTAADANLENTKQPMPTQNTGNPAVVDFAIGTTIVVATDGNRDRNVAQTIRLDANNNRYYLDFGSGAVLTGTWVSRGQILTAPDYRSLFQRVS